MATSVGTPHLTDLHMLVLVTLAVYGSGDAEAVAGWLDLPVALVEAYATTWKPRAASRSRAGAEEGISHSTRR
jgi:hypothetical protein